MKCLKCSNEDMRYFFYLGDKLICRKCLMFTSGILKQNNYSFREDLDAEYKLNFELTPQQKKLSKLTLEKIKEKSDLLIYAACGSGKTEIVLETIQYCLCHNLKVGIAIPRRQVVLQLSLRFKQYFPHIKVVGVCEGFTDDLFGDLIICTTHQLHNYHQYFDVLIIDEPDAFPFSNNPLLESLAKNSVIGNTIYMSATPTAQMRKLDTLTLFRRYHGHDLLVPEVVIGFKFYLYYVMYQFLKTHKKVLLFVPTIALAQKLAYLFRYPAIHSQTLNKEEIILGFEKGDYDVLITTTILERGVTFEAVNICVLYADHDTFSEASLIQIAGRVGRMQSAPTGAGIFLCEKKSEKVDKCLYQLEMMNA